ncbi:TIGR02449 family protein [Amphritea balenae]|uniref:TIGR02449 family protein n=1 Tax=Amphritea balenae TaxID=452629 RepID=A0A3P1SJF5_9GAMM|nr:TIGR02449 family protein [Amphritea balenae]RRC97413.1 TIGR02449 family protein [Amphritea balenae]GGK84207.1 hypothetical protein GCM10007941_38420 [Amphritea balenae]
MSAYVLDKLENQISQLVSHCQKLEQENQALRQQLSSMREERSQLLQMNTHTGQKVDAMISRLKNLEQQA